MRRVFSTALALCALCALGIPGGEAHAQLGDPDRFGTDPASLAHLPAATFDEPVLWGFAFARAWIHDGVVYGGPGVITSDACIPGMDSAAFDGDRTTECGGANGYLVHDGFRVLTPVWQVDQVGFYYGTVGRSLTIRVRLSDATVRDFELRGRDAEGRGTAGYFAYATGDPFLRIEQVVIVSELGAVDQVAFGISAELSAAIRQGVWP